MTILQISLAVVSVVVLFLGLLVVYMQTCFIRNLREQYLELKRELRRVFGWDEYSWESEFDSYKRKTNIDHEKVNELYGLDLIKKALEAKRLEILEAKKAETEREIERLTK